MRARYEVNEWLIWQMANQGPKSGECGHFRRVDQAKEGDQIEVDADNGIIRNITTNRTFKATPVPPFMQELISAGGLMAYTKKKAGRRLTLCFAQLWRRPVWPESQR